MTVGNTKVDPSGDDAETGTSGGWLVVETLIDDIEPTLVFDKNKIKECAPIRRRSGFGGHQKTTREIEALVRKVRETGVPDGGPHVIEKSGDVVHLEALPIFGPDNVTVFGVQVWVGQEPPTTPPRIVGAMAWHADTKYTYHSRSLELDVMRSPEYVPVRTSHEVFRTYLHFAEQATLGAYTQPVVDCEFDNGAEFFGDITLLDAEDTRRRVYLTMRATSDGARGLMRGLVHDVGDYYEPVKQGWLGPQVEVQCLCEFRVREWTQEEIHESWHADTPPSRSSPKSG
ncbi:MAG: GAF domain-containing protein, partial [Rhodococcus sp. (in: high G+C Gram-positive bacteria)]